MKFRIVKKDAPETLLWLMPDGAKVWATIEQLRALLIATPAGRLAWRIEGEPNLPTGTPHAPFSDAVRFCRASFPADEAVALAQNEVGCELVKCPSGSEWIKWALVAAAGGVVAALLIRAR